MENKKVKIAILSSSTINGIDKILIEKCNLSNINAEVYLGKYKQYYQEVLDKEGDLKRFNPEIIFLFIDIKHLLGESYFTLMGSSDETRESVLNGMLKNTYFLIDLIKERFNSKIIIHNYEIPLYTPYGILENKQEFGIVELIRTINRNIEILFREDSQVYVFNYDGFCSKIGKGNIIDYKMYYLADIKIKLRFIPQLCEEYISYIKPLLSITKKCIVLDLDNTLWGGIIGEDGINGIRIGRNPREKSFYEFQRYLKLLNDRGVILAINSKNNFDDVMKVFREHPNMVLKKENFASIQVNWNDKVSNMKTIAKELNIGLDSLIFVDDDKFNRELIRKELPEVFIIDLPEDTSLYLETLMKTKELNVISITDEDKYKSKMYVEQKERQELKGNLSNLEDYLKSLEMNVTIEKANSFNIPRISQLTQKTNQFNMTTKRYMENDIKGFTESKMYLCICIKVVDKFGDNGIVGVLIIAKEEQSWKIDTFLLSCRVIGRNIEKVMLNYILQEAKKEGVKEIFGEFILTEKNIIAKGFYKENGFTELDNGYWNLIIGNQENKSIDYIKVKVIK